MTKQLDSDISDLTVPTHAAALQDVAGLFYDKGWAVGTSGNFSVVLSHDPLRLLITASGKDKRCLAADDFLVVDEHGKPVSDSRHKPSAETMLHIALARMPDVGAVLHTHSLWSTLLSDIYFADGGLEIEGYEMLKGLSGIPTHEHRLWVEIFDNTQDIPDLARRVSRRLSDESDPLRHAYLIRRHGLYTWGKDLSEARRHVEILEFLFEVVARRLQLRS